MSDGIGCKCAARSESECCCEGVSWEPKEIQTARFTIAAQQQKIAALEAENKAIRTLMNTYNLGGWTDSLGCISDLQTTIAAQAELLKLAEDALRQWGDCSYGRTTTKDRCAFYVSIRNISHDCRHKGNDRSEKNYGADISTLIRMIENGEL